MAKGPMPCTPVDGWLSEDVCALRSHSHWMQGVVMALQVHLQCSTVVQQYSSTVVGWEEGRQNPQHTTQEASCLNCMALLLRMLPLPLQKPTAYRVRAKVCCCRCYQACWEAAVPKFASAVMSAAQ